MKPTGEARETRAAELAQLAAYLLTSSRTLLDEPVHYGPFRLIDGARRALLLLQDGEATAQFSAVRAQLQDLFQDQPRLHELFRAPNLEVELPALLDELCLQLARGLRNGGGGNENHRPGPPILAPAD